MSSLLITIFLGLFFSPFAAIMAGIITYSEYLHHFPDNKEPKRMAIQTGIFTFIIFMVISLLIGLALPFVTGSQ